MPDKPHAESDSSAAAAGAAPDIGAKLQAASVESVLQKDAYLVFRALCKLSIRSSDNSAGTDLTVLRGKVEPPQDSKPDTQTCEAN